MDRRTGGNYGQYAGYVGRETGEGEDRSVEPFRVVSNLMCEWAERNKKFMLTKE